eukprot:GHVS01021952.1.p1 GENE.GHVS01021952.1~~GHVS01021952.1.p1  ORF type:complete len:644 (+),score=72.50 GHVS01021952.1:36-1934(+)
MVEQPSSLLQQFLLSLYSSLLCSHLVLYPPVLYAPLYCSFWGENYSPLDSFSSRFRFCLYMSYVLRQASQRQNGFSSVCLYFPNCLTERRNTKEKIDCGSPPSLVEVLYVQLDLLYSSIPSNVYRTFHQHFRSSSSSLSTSKSPDNYSPAAQWLALFFGNRITGDISAYYPLSAHPPPLSAAPLSCSSIRRISNGIPVRMNCLPSDREYRIRKRPSTLGAGNMKTEVEGGERGLMVVYLEGGPFIRAREMHEALEVIGEVLRSRRDSSVIVRSWSQSADLERLRSRLSGDHCERPSVVNDASKNCLTDACTRRKNTKDLVETYRPYFEKSNVPEIIREQGGATTHEKRQLPSLLESALIAEVRSSSLPFLLSPDLPFLPSSLRPSQLSAFSDLSFLVFQPLLRPHLFGAFPLVPRALLFGPSGSGKSFVLRRLAEAYCDQAIVVRVEMSALYGGYVGETESNLRTLFKRIETLAKEKAEGSGASRRVVILVIEGVDRIARKRSCIRQRPTPAAGHVDSPNNAVTQREKMGLPRGTAREGNSTDRKLLTTLLLCLDAVDSSSTQLPPPSSNHGGHGVLGEGTIGKVQGASKFQCYSSSGAAAFGIIATSRLNPEAMEESLVRPGRLERWIGVD